MPILVFLGWPGHGSDDVDDLHREAPLFPASNQRLHGYGHLVPAGENCWIASPQVDGPTGDRRAWLAVRGGVAMPRAPNLTR